MKPDENSKVFLDTTFLLPFFQVEIAVNGFTLEGFEAFLSGFNEIHLSELSIYEAKAKLFRLSKRDKRYLTVLESFGENLAVLRDDEKICFHPYSKRDDSRFNLISGKDPDLNVFDIIILAQAAEIGLLVTEDEQLLNLRNRQLYTGDPDLDRLNIKRWKELT